MVSVNDKSARFDQCSGHLQVFGPKVEIGQKRDKISREHLVTLTRDLFHAKASTFLWLSNNLIKLSSSLLELASANVHHTFVELVDYLL